MGVANFGEMSNTLISLSALPPPALPPFCPLFASLVNILQSDVMLCIMGTILQWAVEHNGYAWSESMLQRVWAFYLMLVLIEEWSLEHFNVIL